MKINFQGVKCDYCTWRDSTVKLKDLPSYIDKPCPECGHNLLTEGDFDRFLLAMKVVQSVKPLDIFTGESEKQYKMTIDTHNTIKLIIEESK